MTLWGRLETTFRNRLLALENIRHTSIAVKQQKYTPDGTFSWLHREKPIYSARETDSNREIAAKQRKHRHSQTPKHGTQNCSTTLQV